MKLYEAYKARPLKGNRIQLYEFRGVSIVRDESGDSKGKPISAFMGQKRSYMLVLAETLTDAILHLQKNCPIFFPDRITYLTEFSIELQQ